MIQLQRPWDAKSSDRLPPPSILANAQSPAFWIAVKEGQFRLQQLMRAADAALSRFETPLSSSFVAKLLARLLDQFAWHLKLEEAADYVGDAVSAAPRLSREANRLQDEHDELYFELSSIVELSAERVSLRGVVMERRKVLRQRFRAFRDRWNDHNDRETELMMEALYVDIGGG